MIRTLFQKTLDNYRFFNLIITLRSLRSIAHRENVRKIKDCKVKTITNDDDSPRIESYEDFVQHMKQSNFGDELEVEKHLAEEDTEDVAARCDEYFDFYSSQEDSLKRHIKKQIVKKKYFNLDKETNLLTYAAKEQIRFLHESNPLEWNYKAISECFPISEEGAKKLLKCSFTLRSPETIKAHDEKVAERWKILKSGKFTDAIAPLTWKLYKEGKLVDDYFSGNPNLPTTPPPKKVIQIKEKKEMGEFSAIVQTYVNYKNQKLLTENKEVSSENQLSLRDNRKKKSSKDDDFKAFRKFKYDDEEYDDDNSGGIISSKAKEVEADVPLSQFKEILKEEYQSKSQSYLKKNGDYESLLKENSVSRDIKKPYEAEDCFLKISKYDKAENVSAMYDRKKGEKIVYVYDENVGYQYPYGKQITMTAQVSSKQFKKGKLHKLGKCVYDDNGQFLYKVPA